jgi:sarcosine oxidase subunit gamma
MTRKERDSMAESATARPLEFAAASWLRPLPPASRFIYCGDEVAQGALVAALGLPGPADTCRAVSANGRSLLWLGPDERLLLAPGDQRQSLSTAIEAASASHPHSLVDVSYRQLGLEVQGPTAVRLLSAQCPLELTAAAFPVGMCTRTIYAKTEIVLWRTAPECFHIEVWRSFAPYLVTLLGNVAKETGA